MNSSPHIGILGGGVSGLYFAWLCHDKKIPFTLLESADRIGGALESSRNEYGTIELGAHTLYNTYKECLRWIVALGLENKILEKQSLPYRLKSGNEYRSLFKSFHWREALWNLLFSRLPKNRALSILEKYTRLFGKRNYQELIGPFFSALLNQNADEFPADWVFKKRKKNKRYPGKFTLEGGLSTLVETVWDKLKDNICLHSAPENLTQTETLYRVQTPSRVFEFSHLVLATPLEQTAAYLKNLFPTHSRILDHFHNLQILSIAVDSIRSPLLPKLAGAITQDSPFRSFITNDDSKNQHTLRSCVFHFKDTKESLPIETIQKALFLTEQDSIFVRRKKINTMPRITLETQKQLLILLGEFQQLSTLSLCGNAYGGVSVEDCLLRSRKEFERLLQDKT